MGRRREDVKGGRERDNVPAIGGKRMAIRPRKMSLEHMVVELLLLMVVKGSEC